MSGSSKRWLKEHFSDPYVKRAKVEGYLSRAVYKLKEIQEKYQILKPGMLVIDLGAAPGGWTQFTKTCIGEKGHIIALDCLPMTVSGVTFIQGDFNEEQVLQALMHAIESFSQSGQVDVVLSDMAPNFSGQRSVDQPRVIQLVELAWSLAQQTLKSGGTFLVKIFDGPGTQEQILAFRRHFKKLKVYKPSASRGRSPEIYLLGLGFKLADRVILD